MEHGKHLVTIHGSPTWMEILHTMGYVLVPQRVIYNHAVTAQMPCSRRNPLDCVPCITVTASHVIQGVAVDVPLM
jgi:hypothetical protein